jgi:hypothetical protein
MEFLHLANHEVMGLRTVIDETIHIEGAPRADADANSMLFEGDTRFWRNRHSVWTQADICAIFAATGRLALHLPIHHRRNVDHPEATKTAPAKGAAGRVVVAIAASASDGAEGILEYRGYDIRTLAEYSSFEEVAFLLWNARLPTGPEFEEMKAQARACRYLPPEIIAALRDLPKTAEPMAALRSSVSLLAIYDPETEENTLEAHLR